MIEPIPKRKLPINHIICKSFLQESKLDRTLYISNNWIGTSRVALNKNYFQDVCLKTMDFLNKNTNFKCSESYDVATYDAIITHIYTGKINEREWNIVGTLRDKVLLVDKDNKDYVLLCYKWFKLIYDRIPKDNGICGKSNQHPVIFNNDESIIPYAAIMPIKHNNDYSCEEIIKKFIE